MTVPISLTLVWWDSEFHECQVANPGGFHMDQCPCLPTLWTFSFLTLLNPTAHFLFHTLPLICPAATGQVSQVLFLLDFLHYCSSHHWLDLSWPLSLAPGFVYVWHCPRPHSWVSVLQNESLRPNLKSPGEAGLKSKFVVKLFYLPTPLGAERNWIGISRYFLCPPERPPSRQRRHVQEESMAGLPLVGREKKPKEMSLRKQQTPAITFTRTGAHPLSPWCGLFNSFSLEKVGYPARCHITSDLGGYHAKGIRPAAERQIQHDLTKTRNFFLKLKYTENECLLWVGEWKI